MRSLKAVSRSCTTDANKVIPKRGDGERESLNVRACVCTICVCTICVCTSAPAHRGIVRARRIERWCVYRRDMGVLVREAVRGGNHSSLSVVLRRTPREWQVIHFLILYLDNIRTISFSLSYVFIVYLVCTIIFTTTYYPTDIITRATCKHIRGTECIRFVGLTSKMLFFGNSLSSEKLSN